MLELFTTIFQFFWSWVPRPTLIGPTEAALCFIWGRTEPIRIKLPYLPEINIKCARILRSQVAVQWDLFEEYTHYDLTPQWVETAILAISDMNGTQWQVRLVVEWKPTNLMKLHFSGVTESRIEQIAGASMLRVMEGMTTNKITELGSYRLSKKVRERAEEYLVDYGIKVLSARAVMFTKGPSLFISQAERLVD